MTETLILAVLFLLILIGIFLYFKQQMKSMLPSSSLEDLKAQLHQKEVQLQEKDKRIEEKDQQLSEREKQIQDLLSYKASLTADLKNLQEKYDERKKDLEELQGQFKAEFKNLAEEILEEKSKKFTEKNQESIGNILNPLKEKLQSFEKRVNETHESNIKERSALAEQIKSLTEANMQMHEDAKNLASAIRGNSKVQGDWGENLLERILEKAGLQKHTHYEAQPNFKTDDGRNVRPDFVVTLPDDRHMIIDSKVSLTDVAKFYEEEDEEKKEKHLKNHMISMWKHVQELRNTNYENLQELKTVDYILMFVPVESAFTEVLKEKPNFFLEALEKNVVVVTGSTLLATLKTVSYIWKQDNLKKGIQEIATAGGRLYDKIHGFIENYEKLGTQLQTVNKTFETAEKQLYTGNGNMVKTAMKLKDLGAKVSPGKNLPQNLIEHVEED